MSGFEFRNHPEITIRDNSLTTTPEVAMADKAEAMRLAAYSLDIGKDAPEMQVETDEEARICNEVLGRVRHRQTQQVYESILLFAERAVRAERERCIRIICMVCANGFPAVLKPHVYRTIPVWVHEGTIQGEPCDTICPADEIRRLP